MIRNMILTNFDISHNCIKKKGLSGNEDFFVGISLYHSIQYHVCCTGFENKFRKCCLFSSISVDRELRVQTLLYLQII